MRSRTARAYPLFDRSSCSGVQSSPLPPLAFPSPSGAAEQKQRKGKENPTRLLSFVALQVVVRQGSGGFFCEAGSKRADDRPIPRRFSSSPTWCDMLLHRSSWPCKSYKNYAGVLRNDRVRSRPHSPCLAGLLEEECSMTKSTQRTWTYRVVLFGCLSHLWASADSIPGLQRSCLSFPKPRDKCCSAE